MEFSKKQQKFVKLLSETDFVYNQKTLLKIVNQYVELFVKPHFNGVNLPKIPISFADKEDYESVPKIEGAKTSAAFWYAADEQNTPIDGKQEIVLYNNLGYYNITSIISILENVSHEYRHYLQYHVNSKNL